MEEVGLISQRLPRKGEEMGHQVDHEQAVGGIVREGFPFAFHVAEESGRCGYTDKEEHNNTTPHNTTQHDCQHAFLFLGEILYLT